MAFGEGKISKITVEGNKKIETAAILNKLETKVGSPFDAKKISKDLKSINQLGYFEKVQADEEAAADGVHLFIIIKEKPIVTKIEFEGLDAFDRDDIKDAILIHEYEFLDIHKLNQTVEKLNQKYEEKGYYLADVRYDFKIEPEKNEAKVTFKIQENDKIKVKTINIIGNNVISDSELKGIMMTKEGDALSWLTGSGAYREVVFERDVSMLAAYYGTKGYVRARFGKPEVNVSPDKKFIFVTFAVEEGDQYFVGNIDFSGELLFTRDELKEDLKLVSGDVFNTETLRRETMRYTEKYSDLGYAYANVIPQPIIHDDTKKVDLVYEIDKGERVYVGRIIMTGNTRTKDKVIRRELRIVEGQLFNGTRKRESRDNVMRLGYFDSVDFHQSTSKIASNVVDIEIKVKERSTGQLMIGAGYASGGLGFTAQAQLSQNNFLGNGQIASLSAQILTGRKFYDFSLSFQEPYFGSSLWSVGGSLYQIRRNVFTNTAVNTFDETKTGFDAKLGHPVYNFTNLYLTYKLENSSVPTDSIIDTRLIPPGTVNGLASSVAASIIHDHRDDRFDPRMGWYGSLSEEFAGLGGSRKFFRSKANFKFYYPIVWDFIFRANFMASNISSVFGQDVPTNELFIQGGLFSLRGYDFLSIGPKRTLSPSGSGFLSAAAENAGLGGKDIVIGGHNEVLMQAEIEFPLLREARLRGVFFFDAGNAFDGWFQNQNPALITNVGFGFRWFTPIGPLRFEFGYPMVGGGSMKFYFTVGPPF